MDSERRKLATWDVPLLNRDEEYVSDSNRSFEDDYNVTYNATGDLTPKIHMKKEDFEAVYVDAMKFFCETEKYSFKKYQSGELSVDAFVQSATAHLKKTYPQYFVAKGSESEWDLKAMLNRIYTAIFRYDVLQPLIDEDDTSDIKISSPHDIRVRVGGKAYKSNANFIDEADLTRFVDGLGIRNKVDVLEHPVITFTDTHDENYILRFTVTAPWVTPNDYPCLHIRKVPKTKPDYDVLIKRGMLNDKIKQYLIDRAKDARCVVFAGPPGSGKSTLLNAFIEFIPKTRETLVIQENDELTTEQSGFIFKHPTHGFGGEPIVTLEDLGRMALVEGCNEFIIGEVKGGEMRAGATIINTGGYAAFTIHSNNAKAVLPKAADLVKYGSDYSFEEAKMMLGCIDTIVYMEGYKVREILECTGYNRDAKDFEYIPIYKYSA